MGEAHLMKSAAEKNEKKRLGRFAGIFSNPLTLIWLGGLLAMVIASLMPRAGLSEMDSGFGRDKLARIITFLLLSFYPAAFFRSLRIGLIISTFIAPLGFILELFQKYVPGRNFSPGDMIANNLGAIIGITMALAIRFFFRTGQFRYPKKTKNSPKRTPAPDPKHPLDSSKEEMDSSDAPKARKKWLTRLTVLGLLVLLTCILWISFTHKSAQKITSQAELSEEKSLTQVHKVPVPENSQTTTLKPDETDPPKKALPSLNTENFEPERPTLSLEPTDVPSPPEQTSPGLTVPEPPLPVQIPAVGSNMLMTEPKSSAPSIQNQEPTNSKATPEAPAPPVEKTVSEKTILPSRAQKQAPSAQIFSLRVGAFLEKENAQKLVLELRSKGYDASYIFTATDDQNRTWHTVRISDHKTLDEATTEAVIFEQKEQKPIYITEKDSLKTVTGISHPRNKNQKEP